MSAPPPHAQVLIMGGGPGGSYAASVLAREGVSVVLLEATKFPRYHVGESLIPSIRHFLRFVDADAQVAHHGFVHKPGSAMKFNQFKREGYTDFTAVGPDNHAWNVIRSQFDQLLLNHARSCGVLVFEQTRVIGVSFDETGQKPVSVNWTSTVSWEAGSKSPSPASINKGKLTFDYLIDASGRAGILSTRYLKNRRYNEALKNIAVWGYWKGVGNYGLGLGGCDPNVVEETHAVRNGYGLKDNAREGAPWFEALTDESGWAWFIPLHNGTTSIGVVMDQRKHKTHQERQPSRSISDAYKEYLTLAPGLVKLIGSGSLITSADTNAQNGSALAPCNGENDICTTSGVRSASDYSYSASTYAGDGFRIVGDAGSFIDPFFSSGIHLALTSALSAAASICAVITGDCEELEAATWHSKRVATSYTRFQLVVLSAYRQIRAQDISILADVDEDGFDRAFEMLRPIIQGASDIGTRLSETELQRSLDFCIKIFNPTTPEHHARLAVKGDQRVGDVRIEELLNVESCIVDPRLWGNDEFAAPPHSVVAADVIGRLGDIRGNSHEHTEARMVLDRVNARRLVHPEFSMSNFETEPLNGYVVRLQKGKLGLAKVDKLQVCSR